MTYSALPAPMHALEQRSERYLLAVLTAFAAVHTTGFMMMAPLAPKLMRAFDMPPSRFALLVSAYSFSAAACSFAFSAVADRFRRATLLLLVSAGSTLTALAAAAAPNYTVLLVARIIAGPLAAINAAAIFAIVADAISDERRGAAIGALNTSLPIATIAGVPLSLFVADAFGWRASFLVLAVSSMALFAAGWQIRNLVPSHASGRLQRSPLQQIAYMARHPRHWRMLALTATISLSTFTLGPFMAAYLVANVGVRESQIFLIFVCGGFASLLLSRWFGRLADHHGTRVVFTWVAGLSTLPVLLVTNLPPVPLGVVLIVSTGIYVLGSGRLVVLGTIVTANVDPLSRAGFASLNATTQQLSAAIGGLVAGMIVGRAEGGALTHYSWVGALSAAMVLACIFLVRKFVKGKDEPG